MPKTSIYAVAVQLVHCVCECVGGWLGEGAVWRLDIIRIYCDPASLVRFSSTSFMTNHFSCLAVLMMTWKSPCHSTHSKYNVYTI